MEYDARSGKIYDERGLVAYTVTVLRDLTAVRRLEQLKMERRMLEMEKFAVAGRLAGTIAHEVNNPMEAIKNCIFMLNDQMKPEAAPVYEILKAETERVARIVRQMLGLYRNTEQAGNVDVNSVVEDTLLLFARQLDRAGVRVEKELEPVPVALGSADQIRQVLSNLVVNAKDSMSQGGVLRVRTHVFHKDDVTGDDSHRGGRHRQRHLRNHACERCSNPSSRRKASAARDWVCGSSKALLRTTAANCACAAGWVRERCSVSNFRRCGEKRPSMTRKSHILVVDDEPNVLVTYRLILQQQGYEVSAALSSEEARKIASRGRNRSLALRFVAGEAGERIRCNRFCAAKESRHARRCC